MTTAEDAQKEAEPSTSGRDVEKNGKGEISAATIGRMMGLATSKELKLLEGKLDLLNTRLTALTVKLDKAMGTLSNVATGSDLERIDLQVANLKSFIKEIMVSTVAALDGDRGAGDTAADHESEA